MDHERDTDRHSDPRGDRLVLARLGFSGRDDGPEPFLTEVLSILEINDDERMVALVSFDLDDIDAATAELDARYMAGEAAAYSDTWSVITEAHAGFNRQELPARLRIRFTSITDAEQRSRPAT